MVTVRIYLIVFNCIDLNRDKYVFYQAEGGKLLIVLSGTGIHYIFAVLNPLLYYFDLKIRIIKEKIIMQHEIILIWTKKQ